MSVGSDFLYSQNLQRKRRRRLLGFGLVALGVVLLVGSGSYFIYAQVARSSLDQLEADQPRVSVAPTTSGLSVDPETTQEASGQLATPTISSSTGAKSTATAQPPPSTEAPTPVGIPYIPSSRFSTIYPGQGIHPKFWDAPYYAEAYRPAGWELVKDFHAATNVDAMPTGSLSPATRIRIPAIEVDSKIRELKVVSLGASVAWETPNLVVGHIPTTPNIGELGRGYLFGHLESPILGEGNVFINLPKIPDLLKKGEEVYAIFTNSDGQEFLYKVFNSIVVHQDDLAIEESSEALVTLVACVPRLVYDHRLVVTAELVGIKTPS